MADAFMDWDDGDSKVVEKTEKEDVKIKKKYENTVNNIEVDDFKPYIKKGGAAKKRKE